MASGSIVVMEAKTDRLVAMASYPSYEPTVFVGGVSTDDYAALVDDARGAPLVFRAIQGAYAPASTFKVISAAAAVQSGDYRLSGRYECPGVFGPTGQKNFDSAALGTIGPRAMELLTFDPRARDVASDGGWTTRSSLGSRWQTAFEPPTMRLVQAGGILTVLALVAFWVVMWRREHAEGRRTAALTGMH